MPDRTQRPRSMNIEEIQEVLPHRFPFLLVDRILEIVPGGMAVGMKAVSMNEEFFQGHFPGHPVMPAVLITEFMAQVAGVLLLTVSGNQGKLAYFAGIDKGRFRKPVRPGDTLVARVELLGAKGHIGKVKASAYVFRLESSSIDEPLQGATLASYPRNMVAPIVIPGDGEGARERKLLLGTMEGELAAEGELMFALMHPEATPGESV